MSTDSTQRKPLTIARILLGQPYVIHQPDSVMVPAVDVRVLAENGGMFQRTFLAFGLSKELVRSAWEREPDKFLKVDLNQSATLDPNLNLTLDN
jgi:hypothetical protein